MCFFCSVLQAPVEYVDLLRLQEQFVCGLGFDNVVSYFVAKRILLRLKGTI